MQLIETRGEDQVPIDHIGSILLLSSLSCLVTLLLICPLCLLTLDQCIKSLSLNQLRACIVVVLLRVQMVTNPAVIGQVFPLKITSLTDRVLFTLAAEHLIQISL